MCQLSVAHCKLLYHITRSVVVSATLTRAVTSGVVSIAIYGNLATIYSALCVAWDSHIKLLISYSMQN